MANLITPDSFSSGVFNTELIKFRIRLLAAIDNRREQICKSILKEDAELNVDGFIPLKRSIIINENDESDSNECVISVHSINAMVETECGYNQEECPFKYIDNSILIAILKELEYFVKHIDEVEIN